MPLVKDDFDKKDTYKKALTNNVKVAKTGKFLYLKIKFEDGKPGEVLIFGQNFDALKKHFEGTPVLDKGTINEKGVFKGEKGYLTAKGIKDDFGVDMEVEEDKGKQPEKAPGLDKTQTVPALKDGESEQRREPTPGGEKALEAAKKKFDSLSAQYQKVLKFAGVNDKSRLEANKTDYEAQVKESKAAEALKSVLFIEKFLGEVESRFEVKKGEVLKQVAMQESRITGYKPPLHERNKKEVKDRINLINIKMDGQKPPEWDEIDGEIGKLETRFDEWDELVEDFKTGSADFNQLKTKSKPLMKLATPTKVLQLSGEKKNELKDLTDKVKKVKEPTVLLDKGAWNDAVDAYRRLNKWLEDNLVAKDDTQTDPVILRMKKFKYDDTRTWQLNAVEYKNGTSAGDIGTTKANDLEIGALSSNTTAGGSVLKVNFEGHAHLDGGSGGVAFVYKLNDDYTVTPTVVDISGKRGGKNGNQYLWNTGGGYGYFPPNANY
jgi:hypothetical protein